MSIIKKISCLLLVITVAFSSMLVVNADTGLVIPNDGLNLRRGPGTDFDIIDVIPHGTLLHIIGCENGTWLEVVYGDNVGFVSMDFLEIYEDDAFDFGYNIDVSEDYDFSAFENYYASDEVTNAQSTVSDFAKLFLGVPYVYGGMSPSGFDCSGFVSYVYSKFGYSLPRRSFDMAGVGIPVSKDNLVPGDILLFTTYSAGVSHVGIYVGDGKLIHAPKPGDVVRYDDLDSSYYASRYLGARRIIY